MLDRVGACACVVGVYGTIVFMELFYSQYERLRNTRCLTDRVFACIYDCEVCQTKFIRNAIWMLIEQFRWNRSHASVMYVENDFLRFQICVHNKARIGSYNLDSYNPETYKCDIYVKKGFFLKLYLNIHPRIRTKDNAGVMYVKKCFLIIKICIFIKEYTRKRSHINVKYVK